MKPANDPTIDYKLLVQQGFDLCAATYHEARQAGAHPELALLASQLKNGAAVLDVGCGTGVPITRALAGYFTVTGVDISSEMIQVDPIIRTAVRLK